MPVINARLVMGSIAAAWWPWKALRGGAGMYHPVTVVYQTPHFERALRNPVNSCQNRMSDTVESGIAVAMQIAGDDRLTGPGRGAGPLSARNVGESYIDAARCSLGAAAILF